MGRPESPVNGSEVDESDRIRRLERRLDRERRARAEAEKIADRQMRAMWLANRELDQRVEDRTAELELALEKLQTATSARDHLLANMSHEVKTPLNGIIGALDLLDDYVADADGVAYLKAARVSAERLDDMMTRILVVVEAASSQLRVEPGPTSLSDLAADVRKAWERKGMQLGYLILVSASSRDTGPDDPNPAAKVDTMVHVDRHRVGQIAAGLVEVVVDCSTASVIKVELSVAGDELSIAVIISVDDIDVAAIEATRSGWSDMGSGMTRRLIQVLGGRLTTGVVQSERPMYRVGADLPLRAP